MEKPLITICIVNYNSSDFIRLNLFAINKLTFNPYKILILDNNSKKTDLKKLQKILVNTENRGVILYKSDTRLRGSIAHGEALNKLTSKIDTEYGVILDADAVFLQKNWDKKLIDLMNDKMPIIGTQADSVGQKPKDFPLMFAIMFNVKIFKKLDIDFRPRNILLFEDTGWELRKKYLESNLSGGLFYDFNTRFYKKGPFADVICSEYYLSLEDKSKIFASHFGRGSMPSSKSLVRLKSSNFLFRVINKILLLPNFIKWVSNKNKWINIANKIIYAESSR